MPRSRRRPQIRASVSIALVAPWPSSGRAPWATSRLRRRAQAAPAGGDDAALDGAAERRAYGSACGREDG